MALYLNIKLFIQKVYNLYIANLQIISPAQTFFPQLQICIYPLGCLTSSRPLKCNMLKNKQISPFLLIPRLLQSSPLSNRNSILPGAHAKKLRVILIFSLSLNAYFQDASKFCWFLPSRYIQNLITIQHLHCSLPGPSYHHLLVLGLGPLLPK